MYCMKCGKETKDDQVFCDSCLSVMAQYPVRQDIRVRLPHRAPPAEKKAAAKRKVLSPEEQISRLRSTVKRLALALVCALILLGFSMSLLFQRSDLQNPENTIGKNYNTINADEKKPG